MADWQPLHAVRGPVEAAPAVAYSISPRSAPTGGVVCAECGGTFPSEEVIRYGNQAVCANCKPRFVQKLREGANISSGLQYATFGSRFAAKILDGIILQVVGYSLGFAATSIVKPTTAEATTSLGIVMFIVGTFLGLTYTSLMHWKFGATVGKMAVKIKVVRADGGALTLGRAIGRSFAEYLSSLTLMIGYLMAAWDSEKRALHDRLADTRVISTKDR